MGIRTEFQNICLSEYKGRWSGGYAGRNRMSCEVKSEHDFVKFGEWMESKDKILKKDHTEAEVTYRGKRDDKGFVMIYTVGAGSQGRKHNFYEAMTKEIISEGKLGDLFKEKLSEYGAMPSPQILDMLMKDILLKADEEMEKKGYHDCLIHRISDKGVYISCWIYDHVRNTDEIKSKYPTIALRFDSAVDKATKVFHKVLEEETKPENVMETILKEV